MSKFKKFLIIILTGLTAISGVAFGNAGIGLGEIYLTTVIEEVVKLKIFDDSGVQASNSITYNEFIGYSNNLYEKSIDISNSTSGAHEHIGLLAYFANKPFVLTVKAVPMTPGGLGDGYKINYNFSVGSIDGLSNSQEVEVEKVLQGSMVTSIGRILDMLAYLNSGEYENAPADNYIGVMTFNITAL